VLAAFPEGQNTDPRPMLEGTEHLIFAVAVASLRYPTLPIFTAPLWFRYPDRLLLSHSGTMDNKEQ
ncbi:MAG TPA: hypothetical protein VFX91_06560, partial [Alcanivorax sp.]|nr:hypothetical protein [Alcanivorax sp.]